MRKLLPSRRLAQPAVDGTTRAGVQNVRITYTETVKPRLRQVKATGPDSRPVPAAAPSTGPAGAKVVVLHLAHPLIPDNRGRRRSRPSPSPRSTP